MALIVEDGSGLADAASYASVTFVDAHQAARGNALWETMGTAEKEQALRRATDYMEQAYRERWAGYLLNTTQALAWPRAFVPIKGFASGGFGIGRASGYGAYLPSNSVPALVQKACAEMAYRAAGGELAPDVGRLKSRTQVGPITVEYVAGTSPHTHYRAIDLALAPLLRGSANSISVARA